MKKLGYALMLLCLVSALAAQQEPKIRESGETFTYAALECKGPFDQMPQKLGGLMEEPAHMLYVRAFLPGSKFRSRSARCIPSSASGQSRRAA